MSFDLISEDLIRDALRQQRVDPSEFETGVRRRIAAINASPASESPLFDSPYLQTAASILPLSLLTTGKLSAKASSLVPLAIGSRFVAYKLLAFVALPASVLFVLLGACMTFHSLRNSRRREDATKEELSQALQQWTAQNKWSVGCVYCLTIILPLLGAPWLLFLLLLISIGSLFYVIIALAKRGLVDRTMIGHSCMMGLVFLGMTTSMATVGVQGLYFFDQMLIPAVLFCGALILQCCVGHLSSVGHKAVDFTARLFLGGLLLGLIVWFAKPTLWPPTSSQIKGYVESFDKARFSSASWRQWEPVATWAIESGLQPDFSASRRLLVKEIAGDQNPFILSYAFRAGLVDDVQLSQLRGFDSQRQALCGPTATADRILSLHSTEWVIRALVRHEDFSLEERDRLETRLLATLDTLNPHDSEVLETALIATELLDAIDRPVDRDHYRTAVHKWLQEFHSTSGGGFQVAGGFKQYPNLRVGALKATWNAIRLMEVYGVPNGLDINWVRSFLRPLTTRQLDDQKWIAAVARDKLDRLPGVKPPSWMKIVYYERGLVTAVILVMLCVGVTISVPRLSVRFPLPS